MLGLHLDLKMSMFRKRYFEKIIGRAKDLRIDTILLEFENKLYIDWLKQAIHPECWNHEDLRWFVAEAGRHSIVVIPKIPLMGHMEWVLQWPWWSHLQEDRNRNEICPLHPETPEFVRRLLQTVIEYFPDAPAIHLGGDESFVIATCPRCKASKKSKGSLYVEHFLPLIKQVEASGKRAMIYADMILAHPQTLGRIPKSTIICDWDYWSGTTGCRHFWGIPREEVTDPAQLDALGRCVTRYKKYLLDRDGQFIDFPYAAFLKERGFDIVLFSAARCGEDNYCAPRTSYHVDNVIAAARRAHELDLMGTVITSWAVRFNHLETNWPAFAAGAWAYNDRLYDPAALSDRFAKKYFGCDWPNLFNDLDRLSPDLPHLRSGLARVYPPDIVHNYIEEIYKDNNSPQSKLLQSTLGDVKKSFRRGLNILRKNEVRIKANKHMYSHWILAAETLDHETKAGPIMMKIAQGKAVASKQRADLARECQGLIKKYRRTLKSTLGPLSTELEIKLRFAEEQHLLEKYNGSAK